MARHHDNARERILDGFEDVLIDGGDAQVTLEGVAAHVGLTKGGLLYHFRSRAVLVAGLVERFDLRTRADLAEMTGAAEGAAASYLKVSDYLASPLHRTTLALTQLSHRESSAAESLARSRVGELAALVADVGDPVVARLTMALAEGLYYQAITAPSPAGETAAVIDWFRTHVLDVHAVRPSTRPSTSSGSVG